MYAPPLQAIDSFLLAYNVGDALLLVTLLGAVGTIAVQRSMKLLSLHLISMGALLVILPASMMVPNPGSVLPSTAAYKAAGLVLIVIAPVLFTIGRK